MHTLWTYVTATCPLRLKSGKRVFRSKIGASYECVNVIDCIYADRHQSQGHKYELFFLLINPFKNFLSEDIDTQLVQSIRDFRSTSINIYTHHREMSKYSIPMSFLQYLLLLLTLSVTSVWAQVLFHGTSVIIAPFNGSDHPRDSSFRTANFYCYATPTGYFTFGW